MPEKRTGKSRFTKNVGSFRRGLSPKRKPAKRLRFGKEETGSEDKRLRAQRGARSVEAVSDALSAAISFLSQEKRYGKKSAWTRLAHPADIVRVSTEFLVVTNTHTHLTGTMVRAACYGSPNLWVVALEYLR